MTILDKIWKKKLPQSFSMTKLSFNNIPYACHLDPNTIVTKQGDLIQVIKISGLSYEQIGGDHNIRNNIREAIQKNISSENISVWLHNMRQKANIDTGHFFVKEMPATIHNSWALKNYWKEKYINEIYITLVIRPKQKHLSNAKKVIDSLWFKGLKSDTINFIMEAKKELTNITNLIFNDLSVHNPEKLKIVIDNDAAHSQIMDFLYNLINLSKKSTELPIMDLSYYLSMSFAAFGKNSFQIEHEGKKMFGAILSLKEHHSKNDAIIEKILKLPYGYIVTQSFVFCSKEHALKPIENLDYILKVSNNDDFRNLIDLDNYMNQTGENEITNYCEQQTIINVIASSVKELEDATQKISEEAKKYGIIIFREDLLLETLYWSNLPANFSYIKRKNIMAVKDIACFLSAPSAALGRAESKWKDAITLFRSKDAIPYFFNFHNKNNNGNCLFIGPSDSGKTVLIHFLISEASRLTSKVFIIGDDRSLITTYALGGEFYKISPNQQFFNPFKLASTGENKDFLIKWLGLLLDCEDSNILGELADKIFAMPEEEKNINNFAKISDNPDWLAKVKKWQNDGAWSGLFSAEQDKLVADWQSPAFGFDFSQIKTDPEAVILAYNYLVHIFNLMNPKKEPAIFLINDIAPLFSNNKFHKYLSDNLIEFDRNNSVLLMAAVAEDFVNYNIPKNLINSFGSKILFPNNINAEQLGKNLGLSEERINIMTTMKIIYRNFVIMQDGEKDIICELNLDGIDYAIKSLAGFPEAIKAMEKVISQAHDKSNWMHIYYQMMIAKN